MERAFLMDQETKERIEALKEEGAQLLMSMKSEHSSAQTKLRVIDEKLSLLSQPRMPARREHRL